MRTSAMLLLTGVVVVGLVLPAAALAPAEDATDPATAGLDATPENGTDVNVTVGQQLSTVIQAEDAEVRTEVEEARFEAEFEAKNESERAEALADRAEELRERAEELREQYREATEAFEDGEISRDAYARRLAVLNARAGNLLESVDELQNRAENVSAVELQAAGLNRSTLDATADSLENVTGAGPRALLERFTGQSEGEVEIETENGFSVEAESEDGERSREIRRPRDDDESITVNQSAALETARAALSDQNGTWHLTRASVHPESGYLKFEFVYDSNGTTGEAEVRIDGSTGEVFRLEEEIEPGDDDHEEEDDEHEDDEVDELALVVAEGSPAPNATVTVQVLADGDPAANATVTLNGQAVGTTGENGTLTVTPPHGKAKLVAHVDGEDAELEFEFEDEQTPHLSVDAVSENGTVTLTVTHDGAPVEGLSVVANGDHVGTTDANGAVVFETDATEELEVEFTKGEFETERDYELRDGGLVPEDGPDGDDHEDEDDDDEADEDEVDNLALSVVEGDPTPGATITVKVTADGEPAAGATVEVDGDVVGETAADGTLTVTLSDSDDARIEAEYGGEDARQEFEFDDHDDDSEDDDDS
ncbi:hypothetical protein BRC81_11480 [Halobacteriales archaeon QS_1_68_20]|nr:MAG: hypothetical protein BRC81_11480 [Halobacteriales archaeon QS_1_68_20]